jgi:hypothetical protein
MHRDESEAHQQERQRQSEVVVVVHAAKQHREQHRGVGEAETRRQDIETVSAQCDRIPVGSLSLPDP